MYVLGNNESKAFRIRHAYYASQANPENYWKDLSADYSIAPTSVKASSNIVSISRNDIYGNFHDWPLAHKAKIIWTFDAESDKVVTSGGHQTVTHASTLVSNFINGYIFNEIKTRKSRVFDISGWVPGYGYCKGRFYLGTPTNFQSDGVNSNVKYLGASTKFELHWIEVGDSSTHIQSVADISNN